MSKIPARTPSNSVKAIAKIGRKATPKHTELYAKSMHIFRLSRQRFIWLLPSMTTLWAESLPER